MTIYLLNSLIVPIAETAMTAIILMKKANVGEVKRLLERGFVSAVGHDSTARLLTQLLGIPIPINRIAITAKAGDVLVHFALRTRLPEGRVLSEEELMKLDYEFVVSEVHEEVACPHCGEAIFAEEVG
jgi:hypothetical protein